jgi:hypothetical protein
MANVFWHHRAVAAAPPAPPFRSRRLNQARWPVKIVAVGGVVLSSFAGMLPYLRPEKPSATDGTWDVASFLRGGSDLARTSEPSRWRRVTFDRFGQGKIMHVRFEDDTVGICGVKVDDGARTLSLTCPSKSLGSDLVFETEGDILRLRGRIDGEPVEIAAKRRHGAETRLLEKRFFWAYDG